MNLTPSQLSALNLASHTAIIANAGSGKTAVLVERYLKILVENPDLHPRNIVAITFTDSSARDLRKKITDALNERLKNSDEGKERVRLLEIKRQLGSAFISTIHSFCIQLLRTYPVEGNVDASFTILSSPEDQLLSEECVRSTFYDILEVAYADQDSPETLLLPVFRLFGRRKVTSLIHYFLNSRFKIIQLTKNIYSQSNEEILRSWREQVDAEIETQLLKLPDVSFFLKHINRVKKNTTQIKAEEAILAYMSAEGNVAKINSYTELLNAILTKEYSLRKALFSKNDDISEYEFFAEELAKPMIGYGGLFESYILSQNNPLSQEQYLTYCRQVLQIYERVLEEYTLQKLNYSFLDYDDVIEYALKLVQKPEIQAELIKRFSHILIDEYQDTDAAQYEIAKTLTGNFNDENRLTVVGDPKQSIYSFRNADLELYLSTIREISAVHSTNSPVVLSETFRILSHPLAFINTVSEYLFDEDADNISKFEFTPLIEGRNDSKNGMVEILLPLNVKEPQSFSQDETEEGYPEDEVNANEIQLIALKIKEITSNNSEKYFIEEKDIPSRPPHFSEIAILLRSRTHQSEIEYELRRNNIPFVTYGGKGFYSRAEIIDITNYLRFLINANDDIALVGILRSPYFGLSDIDLYRLAPERNSISNLWQRLTLYFDQDGNNTIISRAYTQLSENLQLVGRVSTQFLLQKIVEESGILGTLQSLHGGHQKIANLEKYLRFALVFSKEGYSGTFDFIERIALLMERDEMEAQAEPQTDLNAVHLMTIHNSKGLEFPIVFLPYLHTSLIKKDQRNIWSRLDKDLGIGVDLPEQSKTQPVVELLKIKVREMEIEEEKRIFYVAMTRARDHLILSASPKKKYENTRIDWVFKAIDFEPTQDDCSSVTLDTTITKYRTENDDPKTFTESIQIDIPIIRDIMESEVSEVEMDEEVVEPTFQFLLGDTNPSESIGRYSPSQILTYLECPTKYYLRYYLGLPEEEKLPYYNEPDTLAENVQGSLFGQVLHKVLERSNDFVADKFIDLSLLDDTYVSVSNDLQLSEELQKRYIDRVRADIQNVYSNIIGKQALRATEYYTELPLRSKLQTGQMLSGIIDRLFLDEDGVWNILDYKTDLRENVQKKTRYEFQMQFYAYLVSLFYNQKTVKAHILYTNSGNLLSFDFSQADFNGIGNRLENLVSEIRAQKKLKSLNEITRNLSHCPECPYFDQQKNICIADVGENKNTMDIELILNF